MTVPEVVNPAAAGAAFQPPPDSSAEAWARSAVNRIVAVEPLASAICEATVRFQMSS